MLSREELIRLSNLDVNEFNKSTLKELMDIKLNPDDSIENRFISFLEQIENPYYYLVDGVPVEINFSDTDKTLHDCLYEYFIHKKNQDI